MFTSTSVPFRNSELVNNIYTELMKYTSLFCPDNGERPFYYLITTGITMHGGNYPSSPLLDSHKDQSIFIQLAPLGKLAYSSCNLDREDMVQTFFDEMQEHVSKNDDEKLKFLKNPLQSIEEISQTVRPRLQAQLKKLQARQLNTNPELSYTPTDTFLNLFQPIDSTYKGKRIRIYDKKYYIGPPVMIHYEIKNTGYIYIQINAYPERKDALLCSILIKIAINDPDFEITRAVLINCIRDAIEKVHETLSLPPQFKITNIFADFACSAGSYNRDNEMGLGRKKTKKKQKTKKTKKRRKTQKKRRKTKKQK
jgi:hypothetical protein